MPKESVMISVNLKKGEIYRTTIIKKNTNSLTRGITNHEILRVKETSNNYFLVELEIERVVVNTNNNGQQVNYDSSKDESQMSPSEKGLHSRFKPSLNTVISENINKIGVSSNRKKVSGPLNAQMASQKTNFIQLPEQPISVDYEWTQDVKNGKIELTYTYLVTEITPEKVYLECLGIPKGALKGTVEGTIELDRKTGIPVKKELKLDLNLSGQVIQTEVITTIEKY
ncbi:MAG: hypothetical protein HRU50_09865 [Winogradskyella sp.]|uniref:hypothetical protein n=1 Tax=Winogradskyella sp. TaxID=1883156 RepID=UPI0025EDE850|nr:hypothetical protein [Winogradskyella sp.]NRB60225.1 hypothetical protein [Winogradskyella sp.]